MDRNTRTLVVVGLAVLVAALASFGAYQAIQRMPVREVEVRSLYQVVAAVELPMGTMITKDHVKLVAWPASSPVEKGFTTVEQVLNRGVITSLVANEPLTETKLAPIEAGAGLPPSIPEGMRAVSVRVNEVVGVAGFVVPGTRVDVMTTLRGAQGQQSMTRVIVSDVQVLTAGTRYDQETARDGQPIPTSVVTLLLTPEDAEKVTLGASEGQIMLTLRNPMDRKPTQTQGTRTAALFGEPPAPPPVVKASQGRRVAVTPPAPKPVAEPAPKIYSVEAIRAAKRTEEVVR
jgi:pilus assembly protein CpaB